MRFVDGEPDSTPQDVSTCPSPHDAKEQKNRTGLGVTIPLGRCPCCLPPRLLADRVGYGWMVMAERRDAGYLVYGDGVTEKEMGKV